MLCILRYIMLDVIVYSFSKLWLCFSSDSFVRLEDLDCEFGVAENVIGKIQYLDSMVCKSESSNA